jgi:hypothetical protein
MALWEVGVELVGDAVLGGDFGLEAPVFVGGYVFGCYCQGCWGPAEHVVWIYERFGMKLV